MKIDIFCTDDFIFAVWWEGEVGGWGWEDFVDRSMGQTPCLYWRAQLQSSIDREIIFLQKLIIEKNKIEQAVAASARTNGHIIGLWLFLMMEWVIGGGGGKGGWWGFGVLAFLLQEIFLACNSIIYIVKFNELGLNVVEWNIEDLFRWQKWGTLRLDNTCIISIILWQLHLQTDRNHDTMCKVT